MTPRRSLALSGPMGVGKSTIGPILAERAGVPFIDTDDVVAKRFGAPVGQAWTALGEPAFRALEGEIVAELLADGVLRVIALGGGAVTRLETRRSLLREAILVTLHAPANELVARLGDEAIAARPRLAEATDRTRALAELIDARVDAYAEAHWRIDARDSIARVADRVMRAWSRDPVAVALGSRTYSVEIIEGATHSMPTRLDEAGLHGDVFVVSDDRAWPALLGPIDLTLELQALRAGRRVIGPLLLASGEQHKTLAAAERIWDTALAARLDRDAIILAIGGGVVGDVAGFAAATLLRGVRVVQVPTTLLAMVDASVGGKTAIDRPEGKNLVGAFHQPSLVLADLRSLHSLPDRELRAGLAEVVKTALLDGERFLASLERDASALIAREPEALRRAIRASIQHKANVVASDERETGEHRLTLNLGHTVGHALESHGGYSRLLHGEAVALGLIAALRVGVRRGVTEPALLTRVVALLRALKLPHELDQEPLAAALPWAMADKKRQGTTLRFVLIERPGRSMIERLTIEQLADALALT